MMTLIENQLNVCEFVHSVAYLFEEGGHIFWWRGTARKYDVLNNLNKESDRWSCYRPLCLLVRCFVNFKRIMFLSKCISSFMIDINQTLYATIELVSLI